MTTIHEPTPTDERWEIDLMARIAFCHQVGADAGILASDWAIDKPIDFETPHPFVGATTVSYTSDPYWGEPGGKFTAEVRGARWLDLWLAADQILQECGDKHHRYIESFRRRGSTLVLGTGS